MHFYPSPPWPERARKKLSIVSFLSTWCLWGGAQSGCFLVSVFIGVWCESERERERDRSIDPPIPIALIRDYWGNPYESRAWSRSFAIPSSRELIRALGELDVRLFPSLAQAHCRSLPFPLLPPLPETTQKLLHLLVTHVAPLLTSSFCVYALIRKSGHDIKYSSYDKSRLLTEMFIDKQDHRASQSPQWCRDIFWHL